VEPSSHESAVSTRRGCVDTAPPARPIRGGPGVAISPAAAVGPPRASASSRPRVIICWLGGQPPPPSLLASAADAAGEEACFVFEVAAPAPDRSIDSHCRRGKSGCGPCRCGPSYVTISNSGSSVDFSTCFFAPHRELVHL
jgi:hypothetical protein